jgi:flagellar biogenesis protein FliO
MSWWAVASVFGLLAVFAGLSVWARRLAGGPAGDAGVVVVGERRLDAHTRLVVVEADGRRLLLGVGRDGVRLVKDLTGE